MATVAEPGVVARRWSTDRAALLLLLAGLRELPVSAIVSPRLYDDLDLVLDQRPVQAGEDVAPLLARLDPALAQLVGVVRHRVHPYPADIADRVVDLLGEPLPSDPNRLLGLLRRVALAVLELLELLNDEPLPGGLPFMFPCLIGS